MRSHVWLAFPVVVAAWLAAAPATRAQVPDEQAARAAFDEAETEFGRGNYALALRGYQRSYELMEGHPRRPFMLFNIARCFEELGRLEDARDHYQRYLRDSGSQAVMREETEARLRDLETRINLANEGVTPGPPDRESDGAGASGASISPVGPIVLGVGGAMLVAGAIVGAVTLTRRSDVTAMCAGMVCPAAAQSDADEVATLALVTDVLLFGGLAVAAAGLVLTLVLTEGGDDASASIGCGPTGCVGMIRGTL